jgi:alpha-galactosidase
MKKLEFYIKLTMVCCSIIYSQFTCAQNIIIKNRSLEIIVNKSLETIVNTNFSSASKLANTFSASEYVVTKYFTAKNFNITKKDKRNITGKAGNGSEWIINGKDNVHAIEKILSIKCFENFPDAAYYKVQYVNHGKKKLPVIKWVNHGYNIIPSTDSVKFWSFQGSSHDDRRDWIQKIRTGFYEKNFMGMNASDYGGGIPIIDLWRKDAGIATGHTEAVGKMVSLPIDFDTYAATANMHIEYEYPEEKILLPGDTISTYETFVSVHQKDCFASLQNFAAYMQTKGITPAMPEPAAFEPVWCAWGYERDFTLQQILQTLPKVKEMGFKWAGLDDGFQQAEGDWHTNATHFAGGDREMKAFVDSIHAQGMKAVLWWAPLAADPDSKLLKANPNMLLRQKNGAPQFITWWDAFYLSPTDSAVLEETKKTVQLFINDWGFDALKLDGQHMNACAPDYASGHNIQVPEQSYEQMPLLFKTIYETARKIKPTAVIEFCPCGDCINYYHMPYTNQFVASDPLTSWQVRLKGMVYKALMPGTAYFGDHVELTDNKNDFASQIGIGAVPGTKFIYPATGVASKDENLLTAEKEILLRKWMTIYSNLQLSKGNYLGGLYDVGYDYPETHCIEKDGNLYYAFYNPQFIGNIELRGLDENKQYMVYDYFNEKNLGSVNGKKPVLKISFNKFLLIQVKPF